MRTTLDALDFGQDRYRVKVPLPFPLRWVNAYALKGPDGWTIVDPGLRTPESEALWEDTLRELGIGFADVEQIVLTHYHPDHYGLAGWFQERSAPGTPVRISREGKSLADRLWGAGETLSAAFRDEFLRHGMDAETAARIVPHMESFYAQVSPHPQAAFLEPGDAVRLGSRTYRSILTPGHAAGHLMFREESGGELFCGDHVLPQITPNVSWIPGAEPNPLAAFLASLQEVSRLEVTRAFPGHRDPFSGFGARALEIVRHHEERLAAILHLLAAAPASAYAVCRGLFGERLSIHQLRFAMGETLAHLLYLQQAERIRERTGRDDGVVEFEPIGRV